MQRMNPKSKYLNKQIAVTTTNNHHIYTRDMQNIAIVGDESKMYQKEFEKVPISSSCSKQELV